MPKPLIITSRAVFDAVLRDALAKTDDIAKIDPAWTLPQSVKRQLEHMQRCTQHGRNPTDDEKALVDVGPIAVKNFEEGDEQYADWLKELDYAFHRLEQLH